tara:strand:- start:276 stop:1379 length:1104 start_codon:yes stop_codon:yes gene_type:complete
MKKLILLLYLILISVISIKAQITITGTNMLNIGDVINQSEDLNTNINIGSSGQGQSWDFSQLSSDDNWNINVIDPISSPFNSNYPSADVCIMDNGEFIYANKNSSGIYLLGSGDSILQNPLLIVPLPLTFGASFIDGPYSVLDSSIYGNLNLLLPIWFGTSLDSIALLVTGGQAHIPDTLKFQSIVEQDFLVDADGNITLPMGTYDCVRVRQEMTTNTSGSIYFIDTLTGLNSGWYQIPGVSTDNEIMYRWFSNDQNTNFSLVEVAVDANGNQNGSVIFLDNSPTLLTNILPDGLFNIYPIPANDNIVVSSKLKDISLKVYDVSGKQIKSINFDNTLELDLSNYKSGTYLLQLQTREGFYYKNIILE